MGDRRKIRGKMPGGRIKGESAGDPKKKKKRLPEHMDKHLKTPRANLPQPGDLRNHTEKNNRLGLYLRGIVQPRTKKSEKKNLRKKMPLSPRGTVRQGKNQTLL